MHFGTKRLIFLFFAFFLVWIALRFFIPLFAPFLFGTVLALASEPVVRMLHSKLHLPRSVSAGIGVSITFILLCALILLVCAFLIRELGLLSGALPGFLLTVQNAVSVLQQWLLSLSMHTPDSIQPILQENIRSLFSSGTALVEQTVRYLLGFAGNLLSHIPDSALTLGTALLSAYMISARLPLLRNSLLRRIPKPRIELLSRSWHRMKNVITGWLTAQAKLMGVTFFLLFLGFTILRIPYALIWACGISLVDAFPVLGTGTVLLPWSILFLLQGDTAHAAGMLGIYVTVSLIRSGLEPRLVGKHLGLDPLTTLLALYAGFQLWGIGGMLLAPLLAVTTIQLLPEQQ